MMKIVTANDEFEMEPDIVLDAGDFSDEALRQFDRALAKYGLELVCFEPDSDSYLLSIAKRIK